jgi:hypothetical protein
LDPIHKIQKGDIPIEEIKDAWDTAVAGYSIFACQDDPDCVPDYRTLIQMTFKYIICYGGDKVGMDVSHICGGDFNVDCLFDKFVPPDGDPVAAWESFTEAPVEEIVEISTQCFGFPDIYANLVYEIHGLIMDSADTDGRRRFRHRRLMRSANDSSVVPPHRLHGSASLSSRAKRGLPSPYNIAPSRRLSGGGGLTVLTKAPSAASIKQVSFRPSLDIQLEMERDYNGFFHVSS